MQGAIEGLELPHASLAARDIPRRSMVAESGGVVGRHRSCLAILYSEAPFALRPLRAAASELPLCRDIARLSSHGEGGLR
jgi:hypothetical protein